MKEQDFKLMLRAVIDDVVLPYVNEEIKNNVGAQIKYYLYNEMRDEIQHEIRKRVREAIESTIQIRVELTDDTTV